MWGEQSHREESDNFPQPAIRELSNRTKLARHNIPRRTHIEGTVFDNEQTEDRKQSHYDSDLVSTRLVHDLTC